MLVRCDPLREEKVKKAKTKLFLSVSPPSFSFNSFCFVILFSSFHVTLMTTFLNKRENEKKKEYGQFSHKKVNEELRFFGIVNRISVNSWLQEGEEEARAYFS